MLSPFEKNVANQLKKQLDGMTPEKAVAFGVAVGIISTGGEVAERYQPVLKKLKNVK